LRGYDRATLVADGRAGATVAVLLIPQGMAYAVLAGMPAITGLYAAMAALLVYAVLGTGRYSSVAPVAIDSLLVAAAVAPLAAGDPDRYVALAGLLALLTGLVQIAAGTLRLGALIGFVSAPVITGFTAAAALTIAASQLKDLLGVSASAGTTLVEGVSAVIPRLGDTRPLTVAVGVAAIVALIVLRRLVPKLPGPLIVVAVAAAVVALPGLAGQVAVLGPVPSGLPTPALPSLSLTDAAALLPSAAAIALVSYLESISTATAFARRTRTRVNPTGELIAVGAANIAAGFVRGFSVAGGFSRGAVNFAAGARTPMSGVLAAVLVGIALLTITPLLAFLPKVALAAIIMVAVASLVDVRGAIGIARVRHSDLVALLITFAATVVLGPAGGLGVGVAVSIAIFLRQSVRPHLPELGRVPGTTRYRNLARHTDALTDPSVAMFRLDAPLYFANARPVADALADPVASRPDVRSVVLDASAVAWTDYTGVEALAELDDELGAAGVTLHVAAPRGPVTDVLVRHPGAAQLCATGRVHPDVAAAVRRLELDPGSPLLPVAQPVVSGSG
jgi:SulP family sulfate permease